MQTWTNMRLSIFAISFAIFLGGCATQQQSQAAQQATELAIFPGDLTYAEATVNADGRITLTKVEKPRIPKNTLTFNFTKSESGMMLSVENPLDKTVKYHLDMVDFKDRLHNTSSCAVQAGLSVFESWPHPIPEIRVSNTHVASKNEEGSCVH